MVERQRMRVENEEENRNRVRRKETAQGAVFNNRRASARSGQHEVEEQGKGRKKKGRVATIVLTPPIVRA